MDFSAKLHTIGLKATPNRIALLQYIYDAKQPLSYEDIKGVLVMDKATFYRNMAKFEEALLIKGIESTDKRRYYEFHHGSEHAHFVCNDCGKVECLDEGAVDIPGYRVDNIVLKGSCSLCVD